MVVIPLYQTDDFLLLMMMNVKGPVSWGKPVFSFSFQPDSHTNTSVGAAGRGCGSIGIDCGKRVSAGFFHNLPPDDPRAVISLSPVRY
jgi:hypothetical protein